MATSPNGLVLWALGGAGVLLLYSAYKGENPLRPIQDTIGGDASTAPNSHDVVNTHIAGTESFGSTVYDPAAHAASYTVGTDGTGTRYVYGSDGGIIEQLPAPYNSSPGTYIPLRGV